METNMITAMSTLGVGAVFGIVVFYVYRQEKRSTEDRLTKLLEDEQKSRDTNSTVLSELVTLLKKMNGKDNHS